MLEQNSKATRIDVPDAVYQRLVRMLISSVRREHLSLDSHNIEQLRESCPNHVKKFLPLSGR
jgi:hypothetical protein